MNRRSSYADLGLTIAIGIFICLLVKSLLFGFTWGSIAGLVVSAAYFAVSLLCDSHGKAVRHSTTAFLVLSAAVAASVVAFDRNARPKMHAFEGTGDTIQDVRLDESDLQVVMYEVMPEDTVQADTTDIALDSLAVDIPEESGLVEEEADSL